MASIDDDERLQSALRGALAATPGMATETSTRVDAVVAEFLPFARAAASTSAVTPEARSLAWLFAYRLGDQSLPPLAATAALFAWRDVVGEAAARATLDAVLPLVLDGYARAREDRAKSALQRTLGDALPVTEAAPGLVLTIAAGPLDADAARALADRTGHLMLRSEAKAVIADLTGLAEPDAATVAELWAITSSARMLGAVAMIVGESTSLTTALEGADVKTDGVSRAPTLAAGIDSLARTHGLSFTPHDNWLARAYAYVKSAPWSGRSAR